MMPVADWDEAGGARSGYPLDGATVFGLVAMRGLGGLLLLAAAALKMYGLAVEPVGRAGIFSEPWVQTLIVEWELAAAIWLAWAVKGEGQPCAI